LLELGVVGIDVLANEVEQVCSLDGTGVGVTHQLGFCDPIEVSEHTRQVRLSACEFLQQQREHRHHVDVVPARDAVCGRLQRYKVPGATVEAGHPDVLEALFGQGSPQVLHDPKHCRWTKLD